MMARRKRDPEMREGFQRWARRQWPDFPQLLKEFEEEKSHKKQANQFARENPEVTGYVAFPMARAGRWFYRIDKGKSESTSCFAIYMEVEHGIFDWWNY